MVASTLNVTLARPVTAAHRVDDYQEPMAGEPIAATPMDVTTQQMMAEVQQQQEQLIRTQAVLDDLVVKLTQFYEGILSTHRQEIASLALEIARKVLMQKVNEGDYAIEEIIQEALKSAPAQQNIRVHLNPEDLASLQNAQTELNGPWQSLQWVGDPAVGKSECLLETPKGVVKSFIDDHLDKIREALEKAN